MLRHTMPQIFKRHSFPVSLNKCPKIGLKIVVQHCFFTVRKLCKADTVEQQVAMVTDNVFQTIYGCEKHIKRMLLKEEECVYPLRYPGHKWKFILGGNYLTY